VRLSACSIAIPIAVAVILAGAVTPAAAYPQFQLALGVDRCGACHVSPAGGGLLDAYGRDEAGDTISTGGDGRFLHGAWEPPSWFQLGGDLRVATAIKTRGHESELLAFPMQADVNARVGGEHLAVQLTIGVRGGARDPQPPLVERLASREHYVVYQRDTDSYLRAGRFAPVFGIRTPDHTAAIRRYLGFGLLEEPYGIGGGWSGEASEVHATAFVPRPSDVLGAGVKASGVTLYAERRIGGDTAALAGQAKIAFSDADAVATAGVVGKRWFPGARVLLLGELDLQRQSFAGDGPTRYQLAAYGGATAFVAHGWMLGAAVQRWQPDLRRPTARDAVEVNLQYFPRAHVELHLLLRLSGSGDFERPGTLSLLQLHYYL